MPNKDRKARGANSIFFLATCGFLSPILTFAIAMTSLSAQTKISALALVATAYAVIFYIVYHRSLLRSDHPAESSLNSDDPTDDVHISVDASTGSDDTFRAVVRNLRDTLPLGNAVLFEVVAGGELRLVIEDIPGEFESGRNDLASFKMAAISGEVETEFDRAAIPLTHDGRVFGVFGIELSGSIDGSVFANRLTAMRDEMSLKFAAAFAYDRRVSAALTDPVTGLPNERAFSMVLEHQLAESLRHRDERPLSVLAIDISGFAKFNEEFGHAIGDRILRFAAETMRGHFRAMDFLARIRDDEFLAVVPLADDEKANEVAFRIANVFTERRFELDDEHTISLSANFGAATFWQDGETAQQLIQNAHFKKQKAKAEESVGPDVHEKEYVH